MGQLGVGGRGGGQPKTGPARLDPIQGRPRKMTVKDDPPNGRACDEPSNWQTKRSGLAWGLLARGSAEGFPERSGAWRKDLKTGRGPRGGLERPSKGRGPRVHQLLMLPGHTHRGRGLRRGERLWPPTQVRVWRRAPRRQHDGCVGTRHGGAGPGARGPPRRGCPGRLRPGAPASQPAWALSPRPSAPRKATASSSRPAARTGALVAQKGRRLTSRWHEAASPAARPRPAQLPRAREHSIPREGTMPDNVLDGGTHFTAKRRHAAQGRRRPRHPEPAGLAG